jgi:hypothetical protein
MPRERAAGPVRVSRKPGSAEALIKDSWMIWYAHGLQPTLERR